MNFEKNLKLALNKVIDGNRLKSWTKALEDLNNLATLFNAQIELFTGKKLGTAMLRATLEESGELKDTHRIYKFSLVGEGRTKILMTMFIFAVPNNSHYPIWVLNEKLQVAGNLINKELLEQQFLIALQHPDSKFSQTLLEQALLKS
jgi:hypothetical protein